jgi:hypothetical protein
MVYGGLSLSGKRLQQDLAKSINRKGLKSIDCPFYGECLMDVAEKNGTLGPVRSVPI